MAKKRIYPIIPISRIRGIIRLLDREFDTYKFVKMWEAKYPEEKHHFYGLGQRPDVSVGQQLTEFAAGTREIQKDGRLPSSQRWKKVAAR